MFCAILLKLNQIPTAVKFFMLSLKKSDGNKSFVTCMDMNMIRSILTASTHVNVSTF